jgi:hypothetical protein
MKSRVERVRRGKGDRAVHIWGPDYERVALACEVAGTPVVRLESGGFFAEMDDQVAALIDSDRFNVQHEVLDWEVVDWREQGRKLFRSVVVDLEEQEYSADPSWGTNEMETSYDTDLATLARETATRLKNASVDDVLIMCAWRVLDRERGLLTARYGLGAPEDDNIVEEVYKVMAIDDQAHGRFESLRVASQAWW